MSPVDEDVVASLLRRVQSAVAAAERTVARSQQVTSAGRLLRERRPLLRRCAWCGRVSFGGGWTPSDEIPGFVSERVREGATHGICPSCLHRLQREGKSRPVQPR